MLVDNPVQHNFTAYNPSFEEFFNMDLFAGPSNPTAGSSGSSPRSSPSNSYTGLPPTPPEPFSINDISLSPSPFFTLSQEEDHSKLPAFVPPATTAAGYDFLASYAQMSSPESSGSGSGSFSATSGDSPSIDPQLMHTPAASKAASDFDEEEEGEDDDDDIVIGDDLATIPEDHVLPAVKVGGKGKTSRKGTVREGGIVKRSAGVEKKENKQPVNMLSTTSMDPDDWRPSPEEYKKMSSKEKRQLRNKISARNFRVRRKEYISTLEGDIAERDRLIDAIRTELGSMKSENVALRQEIDALKKALLDGRGRPETPVLPPPAPLPAVSAAARASASSPSPPPPRSPLLTPNTQKDLPTSPRMGSRGFWGGAHSSFGSITPVHTTLMPEWSSVLNGKGVPGRKSPALQENINPHLNVSAAAALASLLNGNKANDEKPKEPQITLGGFDAFADTNPFTLKSLDAYRMHLWGRMAQQQAQHRQTQPQPAAPAPTGLAGNLRPHYFAKSQSLSALLSGKAVSSTPSSSISHLPYPTPPNTPPMASTSKTDVPTAQHAMLAAAASQTLFSKLGGAFWDAFARPSGTLGPNGHSKKEWDADKVRRVMEGTAVLKVVDVEPQPIATKAPAPAPVVKQEKDCRDILAESMASLNISRK